MTGSDYPMDSTVERGSTCNPFGYLSLSTPRQGARHRLLGNGPPSRPRRPVPPLGTTSDGSEQVRPVVTPLRILRLRCFLLRSPH